MPKSKSSYYGSGPKGDKNNKSSTKDGDDATASAQATSSPAPKAKSGKWFGCGRAVPTHPDSIASSTVADVPCLARPPTTASVKDPELGRKSSGSGFEKTLSKLMQQHSQQTVVASLVSGSKIIGVPDAIAERPVETGLSKTDSISSTETIGSDSEADWVPPIVAAIVSHRDEGSTAAKPSASPPPPTADAAGAAASDEPVTSGPQPAACVHVEASAAYPSQEGSSAEVIAPSAVPSVPPMSSDASNSQENKIDNDELCKDCKVQEEKVVPEKPVAETSPKVGAPTTQEKILEQGESRFSDVLKPMRASNRAPMNFAVPAPPMPKGPAPRPVVKPAIAPRPPRPSTPSAPSHAKPHPSSAVVASSAASKAAPSQASTQSSVVEPSAKIVRRALLIGINYNGSSYQLNGCIQDVRNYKSYLLNKRGIRSSEIIVLTDDPATTASEQRPTGANIRAAIARFVKEATESASIKSGEDSIARVELFFQYSGHGTNQPDADGDEKDGMDECLVPSDHGNGLLTDDEIRQSLFVPLGKWMKESGIPVQIFAIVDACRSGTCCDLPYRWMGGNIYAAEDRKTARASDPMPLAACISGCRDNQFSADLGQRGGAMTSSFLRFANAADTPTWNRLISSMRSSLAFYGQEPQLTTSIKIITDASYLEMQPVPGNRSPSGRPEPLSSIAGGSVSQRQRVEAESKESRRLSGVFKSIADKRCSTAVAETKTPDVDVAVAKPQDPVSSIAEVDEKPVLDQETAKESALVDTMSGDADQTASAAASGGEGCASSSAIVEVDGREELIKTCGFCQCPTILIAAQQKGKYKRVVVTHVFEF